MYTSSPTPLIGIPADSLSIRGHRFHGANNKYVPAITKVAKGLVVIIPNMDDKSLIEQTLAHLDGIVITGAPSNVHPELYGQTPSTEAEPYDRERDLTSLHLIRSALKRHMPLLAICRGIQELNVALGGTLDIEIHDQPGNLDHRQIDHEDVDTRYGPQHDITLTPGGCLAKIMRAPQTTVNSLHRQSIGRLADTLKIEAKAPDGTIEAVSVTDARGFALGVQWHPEHDAITNPHSGAIFEAFGDAARQYAQERACVTV